MAQLRQGRSGHIGTRLVGVLTAVALAAAGMVVPGVALAEDGAGAASQQTAPQGVQTKADADTRYSYETIKGVDHKWSTQFNGRVWTDKSVSNDDELYFKNPDTGSTQEASIKKEKGEDFLTTFSALATSTMEVNQVPTPTDTVITIDLSPMSNSDPGKLNLMLDAVNQTIDKLMGATGEQDSGKQPSGKQSTNVVDRNKSRVAVVAYSNRAEVLVPLAHYKPGTVRLTSQRMVYDSTKVPWKNFTLDDNTQKCAPDFSEFTGEIGGAGGNATKPGKTLTSDDLIPAEWTAEEDASHFCPTSKSADSDSSAAGREEAVPENEDVANVGAASGQSAAAGQPSSDAIDKIDKETTTKGGVTTQPGWVSRVTASYPAADSTTEKPTTATNHFDVAGMPGVWVDGRWDYSDEHADYFHAGWNGEVNHHINKYTQYGLYVAMQQLADISKGDLTVNVGTENDPKMVHREPALILMSEGDPKIASVDVDRDNTTNTRCKVNNPKDSCIIKPIEDSASPLHNANPAPDIPKNWRRGDKGPGDYNEYGSGLANPIIQKHEKTDKGDPNFNHDLRHAQTFATVLTAAYWTREISKLYSADEDASQADSQGKYAHPLNMFTVGIRPDSANSPALGRIALNPRRVENSSPGMDTTFKKYFTTLTSSSTAKLDVGDGWFNRPFSNAKLGFKSVSDLYYVPKGNYQEVVESATGLDYGPILENIAGSITNSLPKIPTEVTGDDPTSSGYITYTDPIGRYMEIGDVRAVIFNGKTYTEKKKSTAEDGTTSWTFEGTVPEGGTGVYVNSDMSKLLITATADKDGDQTLKIRIPATLIPVRYNKLTFDDSGNVVSNEAAAMLPIRVVYSTRMRKSVTSDCGTGDSSVRCLDASKVDVEAALTGGDGDGSTQKQQKQKPAVMVSEDGTVSLYSNMYSGDKRSHPGHEGITVGDAVATFTPAATDPFYYMQEDTPLLVCKPDRVCTDEKAQNNELTPDDFDKATLLPNGKKFDDNTTYWLSAPYWDNTKTDGTGEHVRRDGFVSSTGKELNAYPDDSDTFKVNEGGEIIFTKGSVRVWNLHRLELSKSEVPQPREVSQSQEDDPTNPTGTASMARFSEYHSKYDENFEQDEHMQDNQGAHFAEYLGNNGMLQAPLDSDLVIGKKIAGRHDGDATSPFAFRITTGVKGGKKKTGTVCATLTSEKGASGAAASGGMGTAGAGTTAADVCGRTSGSASGSDGSGTSGESGGSGEAGSTSASGGTTSDQTADSGTIVSVIFDENGTAVVTLKAGQTLRIPGMYGVGYTVQEISGLGGDAEKHPMPLGYVFDYADRTIDGEDTSAQIAKDQTDKTLGDTIRHKDQTVTVTNRYIAVSSLPFTGGSLTGRILLLAGLGVLLVAGAAYLLARRRHRHGLL